MDVRADLVNLISNGTQLADVIHFFTSQYDFTYGEAHHILQDAGVVFLIPKLPGRDEISDDRRAELQELSFTLD